MCLVPLEIFIALRQILILMSEFLLAHPYFKLDIEQDPMFIPLLIKQET